ncbi:glycosyltransferase [Pseudactinotalea sp. HY158]|uniref:glycosyltransferase n=1 Tax=Pseudactinotalea sp. HY158 TaxID=2654547 RepID=UPI00129C3E05|nr:glycosyltransferase [Pseudactinotalea sp. HY158]QGH69194.1 glycosyltransferase [Pseudactinotalea sp. HY158]
MSCQPGADGPPLRIALVSMHTSPIGRPGAGDVGGMNVVVRQVAERLGAAGHSVDIYCRRGDGASPARVSHSPGVVVHHLPAGPPTPLSKAELEDHVEEFTEALAREGPWDILHSHHWFSGMSALAIARERGLGHVQSFHSIAADPADPLAFGERPEGPGRLPGERLLARESDAVIAVSHAEANTAVGRLGSAPSRVVVVPPGVDSEQFHPIAPTGPTVPGTSAGRPRLVVAARLEPLKGVDLAIEALARLDEPRPLLVVSGAPTGGFADYAADLHELARGLHVAGDVEFAGPLGRADLAERMRHALAVLVPSHSETYGLVALEGAASGRPVIASRAGGLSDAVLDGVTGILLPDRDPEVWAGTIRSLLEDPGRAAELGRAGREHALAHPWQATAAGWERTYRHVIATGGHG